MAHAHTPYKYPVNVLPIKDRQVVMYLTQEEAEYLAQFIRDSWQSKTANSCVAYSCCLKLPAEPTQHTIHRQRIFAALSGVTKPS